MPSQNHYPEGTRSPDGIDARGAVRSRRALLFLLLAAPLLLGSAAPAQELRVAAAADLQYAMADLTASFAHQTGTKVVVTYGSSGNFFAQLQNGAPFDLFFSADLDYPQKLEALGLTEPGTLSPYALGRIVLWLPPNSKIDVSRQQWNALLDPAIQKIAIANPEHAPYGRAAVAALKAAGFYDRVQGKLVFGENISQAAQFVQSGTAQAGIVALSLAVSPAMKDGKYWQIPGDLHPPLRQAAVVLKSSAKKDRARAFLAFLKTPPARAIFSRFGFLPPDAATPPLFSQPH